MRKLIICMLCLVTACILNVTALAAPSYTIDYANNTVTISGKVSGTDDVFVALHVLRPEKTYENCDPNSFENVAYAEQVKTVKGEYTFSFKLDKSGLYNAYVGDGSKEPLSISFIDYEENKGAIEDLNDAAKVSYDEFVKVLGEKRQSLGFHLPLYDEVTKSEVDKELYDLVSKTPFTPENGADAVEKFEQITVIIGLNEEKVENLADYEGAMGLKTGEMKDWYTNPIVTDSMMAAVTERISGKGIEDMDEFNDLFKEALILEIVKTPNVAANATKVIKDFADDIGVDTDGVKDSVYLSLAGNNYNSYSDLRKAFNAAKGNSSSGGSSSIRGNGGSGISGGGVTLPPADKEPAVPLQKGFDDLDGFDWAKTEIIELAEKGIVSYNIERKFNPSSMITREEFVKLLVELFDLKYDGSDIPFTDVNENDWFYPYVATAYKNGLCLGISETEFGSGLTVKRQDIAVLVDRAVKSQGRTLEALQEAIDFVDSSNIDEYAVDSVNSLCGAEILKGNPNGEFLPQNGATRAEAAVIIHRLIKYAE